MCEASYDTSTLLTPFHLDADLHIADYYTLHHDTYPSNHDASHQNPDTLQHHNTLQQRSDTSPQCNDTSQHDHNTSHDLQLGSSSDAPDYKEFLCGWGAAFCNVSITFPLNKVIFRQMLHGVRFRPAFYQLYHEGLTTLYRGLLPPLIQRTSAMSLMFGSFDHYHRLLSHHLPLLPASGCVVSAGLLAGTTEALLTPLERVQMLLQAERYHRRFPNTWRAFSHLWPLGLAEYYRGVTAILLRNGPSNAIFFTLRHPLREMVPGPDTYAGNYFRNFVSGAFLGAAISTLFYPVNVVKTRMMSVIGGPHHSFTHTLGRVLRERQGSLSSMFRGVHVNFTRSLISWGIINATYELLRSLLE